MKVINTIATWENDTMYQIDQIYDKETVCIVLRDIKKSPYGVLSVIRFSNIGRQYINPVMNWENLIRCSNYYGLASEEIRFDHAGDQVLGYNFCAVQKGIKPAATCRLAINDPLVQSITKSLPESCMVLPYLEENTTFICRKGSLRELYDLQEVQAIYEAHGVFSIDWNRIEDWCSKDICFFADSSSSGIMIEQGASGTTEHAIVGLLLGYPLESTVATIKHTQTIFPKYFNDETGKKHFLDSSEPFLDSFKRLWRKENDCVFMDGQQESNYYD